MTKKIYSKNTKKIYLIEEQIEKKIGVKINIKGRKIEIEGTPVEEYEASIIIEALDFGFKQKDALKLADENNIFRKLPIKKFTAKKNLEEVRGRIIGTEGKTKRTLEEISGCAVVIHNNQVGMIGPAENIEEATTALTKLIKGSKQANVYRFLEKMNAAKREKLIFKQKSKENKRKNKEKDNQEYQE